ncbi:mirror-image polydactyly gene 1 protein isoform X3 [Hydra vulgaris]|uniref:Mirror-image polydactyly gene 1 protein isoform X3 n=2 Tax=Hydra vulgaris TaxID=6087 RepID=A0ABM4C1X7_HYDVU
MAPDFDDLFDDAPDLLSLKQYLMQELDSCNVEDLKLSLKKCLTDARKKIAKLRKEIRDQQEILEKERVMRETAENELRNLSNNLNREYSESLYSSLNSRSNVNNNTRKLNGTSNESLLMEELKSSRLLNKTLTEKLSLTEVELEKVLQNKKDIQMEMEVAVAAQGAVLIDKIYTAQKARDAATSTRLKLLTHENEELLKRIKQLEIGVCGCDSVVETNLVRDDLLIQDFNNQKPMDPLYTKKSTNESKSLMEEDALKQVVQLKEEYHLLKERCEMFELQSKNEKNRLTNMQDDLKNKQRELDEALAEKMALQAEIQSIKLRYSLSNSLSNEQVLRDQFNTTLDEFELKFIEKESKLNETKSIHDELLVKYNNVVREKKAIAEQLQDTLKQATEDKKRADKLERLVDVLRKRKNNTVSSIIE